MSKLPKVYWLSVLFALISWGLFGQSSSELDCSDIDADKGLRITKKNISVLDDVCNCAELKRLTFKKVPVLRLPQCLIEMDSLQTLSFEKSPIRTIPETVLEMQQIETLDLSYTHLYVLPDAIANMPNLRYLNVSGTHISILPEGLDHLARIDMYNVEMTRAEQKALRAQYPQTEIYLSSPCKCD